MQQIIVEALINTRVNYPSKHCQPTETIAVQFVIWQNQWMARTSEQLRTIEMVSTCRERPEIQDLKLVKILMVMIFLRS